MMLLLPHVANDGYRGDWIMALAWSLPTGFETPVTYFYAAYFMVLLVHRQLRDDEQCEKKYVRRYHLCYPLGS